MSVVVAGLLGLAVLAVAVSVVGVLVAQDALDRMHYLGPSSVVGGPALLLAVIVQEGVGAAAGRVALTVVLLSVGGVVLTHATARAALVRGDVEHLRDHTPHLDEP